MAVANILKKSPAKVAFRQKDFFESRCDGEFLLKDSCVPCSTIKHNVLYLPAFQPMRQWYTHELEADVVEANAGKSHTI